jgi:hypothetical protein
MEEYLWQREGTPFWQMDINCRLEDVIAAWWMYFINRYTILSSINNVLSIEIADNCVFTIRRDPSVDGIALYALQITLRGDSVSDLAVGIVQFRSLVNGRTRITLGTRLPLHARIEALPGDQELPISLEEVRSAFEDHQAKVYEWQKATLIEHVSTFLAWFQADQQNNSATFLSAESSNNSDSAQQAEVQKRQSGGRKTATVPEKKAVVEGWLAVQAHELQEVYCADKGISPSTLRRWARELDYTT